MKKGSALILGISLLLASCEADVQDSATQQPLPYFGNHDIQLVKQDDGSMLADTVYFEVPPFAFTDQSRKEVSHKNYEGHIYVADFFFTTCPTICPVMSSQLSRLQDKLKNEGMWGEIRILSHSVNPEYDSPEILDAYAVRMGADTTYWKFATGDKNDIYDQARFGYYLTALESDTAAGGFFHSDTFALIDENKHIRGYYDGTSTSEVNQLFIDIKRLLQEP